MPLMNEVQGLEELSMGNEFEKEQAQKVLALFVGALLFCFDKEITADSAVRAGKLFAGAADAEGIGLDQIFGGAKE